jgi:hypothetical protein
MQDTMLHAIDRMEHLEQAAKTERTPSAIDCHVVFGNLLNVLGEDED